MVNIGVLVGSIREGSYSKQIADNTISLLPENYHAEFVEIENLPFYKQNLDDENKVPEEYLAFRRNIKQYDAFLFVTPEYNRSIPGVLKNALDLASRPKAENAWNKKPAGIISVSPGALSAFGANHHLRQILVALNMPVVQQPEVYIGQAATLLDEQGKLNNEGTTQFLQSFLDTFIDLIERHQ